MRKRAPANTGARKYALRRDGRCAVAVLCLALVCLFAGISAAHQHAFPGTEAEFSASGGPCELCAVAIQAAIVFAVGFFLLHALAAARPLPAAAKSKSHFSGTSVFFRPPPFLF